ncbi:MAG: thermonuclease family protein, partial [Candidatus Hydrogenedentes bacterium]|nr:thermonuclease family protein [Candidatus Hydrogenedentota bacterium]
LNHNDKTNKVEYYQVKEVISPHLLILNNGLKIRLIGIKVKPETKEEAIKFLQKELHNQKVFIKLDQEKYDIQNHLLVYLYLKNKTFINMHLIKHGLVDVDFDMNYALKDKFLKLHEEYQYRRNGY